MAASTAVGGADVQGFDEASNDLGLRGLTVTALSIEGVNEWAIIPNWWK
jgi:hypothetical protein